MRVIIPYGGDDPHRNDALEWVVAQWAPHAEVALGVLDGPWSKAAAISAAVDPSWPDDDILIIADADVWVPGFEAAVARVHADQFRWAIPHRKVIRLDPEGTGLVLGGLALTGLSTRQYDERPYIGTVGGGMVILKAGAYRDVPMDPRFVGWGQEDESWACALKTILGDGWRGPSDLFHLWHPAPVRRDRVVGTTAGEKLRNRYRAARGNERLTRCLLDEFRQRPTPGG